MALIPLTDLFRAETRAEVEETMLGFAADLGFSVSAWQAGGVARTIIAVVAQVIANLSTVLAVQIQGGFLDYSTGGWLTLLAYYVYGVDRTAADAGDSTLTLTNASATTYGPYAAGALHFAHATTGKTYKNAAAVASLPPGATTIDIVADEVGTGSNAAIGTITSMVTVLIGVTCSNPDALVGVDAESDLALRERCRAKLGALSPNGAKDAYVYVATSTTTAVNRARTVADPNTGTVALYLAGPEGEVDSDDVELVDEAVQEQAVPLTVTVETASADGVSQAIVCNVHILSTASLTLSELQTLVENALLSFFKTIPIGGYGGSVPIDLLQAKIAAVSPYIFHVAVTTPAADIVLDEDEVLVLSGVTTTRTVVQA